MSHRERVSELQRELRAVGSDGRADGSDGVDSVESPGEATADAAVLYPGPNALYFAGVYGEPLDRHFLVVVPETGDPWVVTPPKCLDAVRENSWIDRTHVVEANEPAVVARGVADSLSGDADRLLLDDRAPFAVSRSLRAATDATLDAATPVVEPLRIRKGDDEIAALRRSAAVADEVSTEIRAMGGEAVGAREAELADEIRGRLHVKGATRLSFDVVVASGQNGADPYRRNGDREIEPGDAVVLDFGGFVDGYASDQTRTTVFASDPPPGFAAAHDAVREALDAAVAAVEPGVPAGSIDRTASDVIRERGYGEHLVHATGHGVGLEAHEAPAIVEDNGRTLEPGMVFSVEPGVYVDGEFGVRLEDLVVVTDEGCERLNDSPRTWRPL